MNKCVDEWVNRNESVEKWKDGAKWFMRHFVSFAINIPCHLHFARHCGNNGAQWLPRPAMLHSDFAMHQLFITSNFCALVSAL